MKRKGFAAFIIVLSIIFVSSYAASAAQHMPGVALLINSQQQTGTVAVLANNSNTANVHTKAQIAQRYQALMGNTTFKPAAVYTTSPNPANYVQGTVSASTLNDGLNTINMFRYIAGVPDNVALNADLTDKAQAASMGIARIGRLVHTPRMSDFPGVSAAMYNKIYDGTSHSNLAMGYNNISSSIFGYIQDAIIPSAGHRTWLLNPKLTQTGLGHAASCSAAYVIGGPAASNVSYNAVTWPAKGDMPIDFFQLDALWTVYLGPNYRIPVRNDITITLTRKNDGKSWIFNRNSFNPAVSGNVSSTQSFYNTVSSDGENYSLVFRPPVNELGSSVSDLEGQTFSVRVEGLRLNAGNALETLTYDLTFYKIGTTLTLQAGQGGRVTSGSSGSYSAGSQIKISASPSSGYVFKNWTSTGGGTFANVSNASTTFTMPASSATVTAIFERDPNLNYRLTVQAGQGGTVTAASGDYKSGTAVTLRANANSGYVFSYWASTGGGSFSYTYNPETTFIMPAGAATVTAYFESVSNTASPGYTISVGTNADGRLENYAVGADGRFYYRFQSAADVWTSWQSLSDRSWLAGSHVGVGRLKDGRLQNYIVGRDGLFYTRTQTRANGTWTGWTSMQTSLKPGSYIAVGQNADGRLEQYVVGTNNVFYSRYQTANGQYTGWSAIHADGVFKPGAYIGVGVNADGRLENYAINMRGELMVRWQRSVNGAWTGWQAITDASVSWVPGGHIGIGRNADGTLENYIIRLDGTVMTRKQMSANGAWTSFTRVSGVTGLASSPITVGRNSDGRLEVYVAGSNGRFYYRFQTAKNGGWTGWTAHNENYVFRAGSYVLFAMNRKNRAENYIVNASGVLMSRVQKAANSSWSSWTATPAGARIPTELPQ